MTTRACLAAALAVAALGACTSTTTTNPGALLSEPSSVAVFRGVTIRSGRDDASPVYPYRPYLAIANAGSNEISVVDGVTDAVIPAPIPTRGLGYPAPGRPMILASGDLGDRDPDLLVVVTAGDLPWLGGTQLRVVRTWAADGSIVDRTDGGPAVDLGADVLALLPLPFDPVAPGSVTLVAALAGERLATVTFSRAAGSTAIDVDAAQATVTVSPPLGFQPLALAAIPGERTRVFAASEDPLPGGVQGVAEIAIGGATPFAVTALNAHAPTRLVAAGHLAEAIPFATALDASAFAGQPAVDRVWAVLDESACGFSAAVPCGLVTIDPASGDLVPDPTPAGTMNQGVRAPIRLGYPLALAFSGPPAVAPSAAEPQYAGTYLRVAMSNATWQTTGVLGVASADGTLTFVDAARWAVPSNQSVLANVKGTVTSTRPPGTAGTQWLTLVDPSSGATVAHTDASRLTAAVGVTGGYTPSDRWTITREGVLPGLSARRAESFGDGTLALQVTTGGTTPQVQEVVRLWDPTLGVTPGDTVVLEPTGLGTCTTFEATVAGVSPPTADRPGGYVTLGHRTPTVPAWDRCVDQLAATRNVAQQGPGLLATIRASGYVLTRGTGTATVHVGRPIVGVPFAVEWQDEAALTTGADACTLPPAVPWPGAGGACGPACRASCEALARARVARRLSYVDEAPAGLTGPALVFTLGTALPTAPVPRDLSLTIDTVDGRAPFRVTTTAAYAVDPRQALTWDRSPWAPQAGVRFLVPWAGGAVLDATPTLSVGTVVTVY